MTASRNLFFIICFLSFSVNSIAQRLPEEQLRFHKDHTEKGLIFGTITFPEEKLRFDGIYLNLNYISDVVKIHKKFSDKIKIGPTMLKRKHNGELDNGRTYLFVMEEEPGQYEINYLRLTIFKITDHATNDTHVSGFSIPFEVKKGEIKYIGNINIDEYGSINPWMITVRDQFERDKNAMKERQKMVNWDAAIKSSLTINGRKF